MNPSAENPRFPHGDTGDEQANLEFRDWLLEESLDQVFAAYDHAIEMNTIYPVVFLIGCEDAVGGPIARAWEGDEAVDEAIAHYDDETDRATTLARAFPLADCRTEVPDLFPYLSGMFAEPPPQDGFWAIVIACGGASSFTVPFAAR